jgi:hypothetical protein
LKQGGEGNQHYDLFTFVQNESMESSNVTKKSKEHEKEK